MKLGIISDAHHYYDSAGQLHVLEIVARQFEQWAVLFDEVVVCAPLMSGQPPATHSPYRATNLRLLPIANAGGNSLRAKLDLVQQVVGWWRSLQMLFCQVDAVHIRCPNNISVLGLLALHGTHLYRQAAYTGTWNGYPGEPLTYRWQRYFLSRWFKGPVAVYGDWLQQPAHIVSSFSPSYSYSDWQAESDYVESRLKRLRSLKAFLQPLRLVSVGALNRNKNQQMVIRVLKLLIEQGWQAELNLFGDGNQRPALETLVQELGLGGQVHFNGAQSHQVVRQAYRQADFVVQATYAEGYGKVPIEAFFHGAVPILSDVGMSSQIVGGTERGACYPFNDVDAAVLAILNLATNPAEMVRRIENGRQYAKKRTLEEWREHIAKMSEHAWQIELCARTDSFK